MNVVTYQSQNHINSEYEWLAYIVLPNNEYWNVRFNGATEEVAKAKALALWEKEKDKILRRNEPEVVVDPWSNVPDKRDGSHIAGKVWIIHNVDRSRKRVNPSELETYLCNGWSLGGPRSK